MYYPKSQIVTKSTNGGELQTPSGENYVGNYFETSDNRVFAGTVESPIPLSRGNQQEEEPQAEWTVEGTGYQVRNEAGVAPKNSQPRPTPTDISNGVFPRFFVQKRNEAIVFEVNREQYDMIQNRSNRVQWQLYQAMRIDWVISGDKNEAFNSNRNAARDLGILLFFKGDFLKYFVDTTNS